jgi:hypothetical protein
MLLPLMVADLNSQDLLAMRWEEYEHRIDFALG